MLLKALVCERMGWTFRQFDAQPANEVAGLVEIWNLREKLRVKS